MHAKAQMTSLSLSVVACVCVRSHYLAADSEDVSAIMAYAAAALKQNVGPGLSALRRVWIAEGA